jgi:hypothetical protein
MRTVDAAYIDRLPLEALLFNPSEMGIDPLVEKRPYSRFTPGFSSGCIVGTKESRLKAPFSLG